MLICPPMQVLNCLIVEDEPLAAEVVKHYISQVPGLELKGMCEDVLSASEKLRSEKIDVIFLDIYLPKINGLDFLKTLQGNYKVILTTAYHEYALDGFDLNVVDYLLKPIEFSRFVQAVNKVYALLPSEKVSDVSEERPHTFFYADKKRVKVFFEDILYIESLKDYIRVHTASQKLVTKMQIGEADDLLRSKRFVRIHKSFIINLDKISSYSGTEVEIGTIKLPIGRVYKEFFKQEMRVV